MKCTKCGTDCLGEICVYCAGKRERTPAKVLTMAEWRERMAEAALRGDAILAWVLDNTRGPGEAVLAMLLAAAAITDEVPQIPSFEWYAVQVQNNIDTLAEARKRDRS